MTVIAWVIPGLAAGTFDKMLIRGLGAPGIALIGATGVPRTAWL
ncbi:MAG: hypothetical protein QOG05_2514 [Streptosporangiaceae bacterium]|jgi:hypothetical protein|nr:hypothetical protein [Streptosporangiaceae bacterium]